MAKRKPNLLSDNPGTGPILTIRLELDPWYRVYLPGEEKPPAPKRGRGRPQKRDIIQVLDPGYDPVEVRREIGLLSRPEFLQRDSAKRQRSRERARKRNPRVRSRS